MTYLSVKDSIIHDTHERTTGISFAPIDTTEMRALFAAQQGGRSEDDLVNQRFLNDLLTMLQQHNELYRHLDTAYHNPPAEVAALKLFPNRVPSDAHSRRYNFPADGSVGVAYKEDPIESGVVYFTFRSDLPTNDPLLRR